MNSPSYARSRTRRYRSQTPLDRREELVLLHRWRQQGDELAHGRLVEASMKRVLSMAMAMRGYAVPIQDLIAEGSLGLMVAIEKFDPTRNVRLSTYASFWIRAYMFRAVIKEWNRGRTGLGRKRHDTFFRLRKMLAGRASRRNEAVLDVPSLAEQMGLPPDQVQEMLDYLAIRELSLDSSGDFENPTSLHEAIASEGPDPEQVAARRHDVEVMRQDIHRAMNVLTEREKHVVTSRLMSDDPPSLASLGTELGVSRERVRQIEVEARSKLQRAFTAMGIQ